MSGAGMSPEETRLRKLSMDEFLGGPARAWRFADGADASASGTVSTRGRLASSGAAAAGGAAAAASGAGRFLSSAGGGGGAAAAGRRRSGG